MIFAAGLGTRLRPLTDHKPKAMVEVNGKPLLEHLIVKLCAAGFDHVVINVHHFAEQITGFVASRQNFGIDIRISDERDMLLDTGGGLRKAMPLFDNDDPVLVHNVDIASDADLAALYHAHCESEKNGVTGASLVINQRETSRYLLFDNDCTLRGWTNIKTGEVKGTMTSNRCAFTGIHIVSCALVPYLNRYADMVSADPVMTSDARGTAFPIMDFYLKACLEIPIRGILLPEACRWVDCGKVESLSKAAEILL